MSRQHGVAIPHTRFALTLLAAVLTWSCGDGSPLGANADVRLSVDFDTRVRPVGQLIGWNIGSSSRYAATGDTRHPEWRTPEVVDAVSRLQQVRAANGDRPLMRFSGLQIDGQLGNDGYHFWRYANPTAPVEATDNVSPAQYMAIMDEAEADPVIMLNFGSGTSTEAAEYVRHLVGTEASDPFVAARRSAGRTAPWPTDVFEVGNEIHEQWNTGHGAEGNYSYANPAALNGGDSAWHGRPASDPADFAARALEYVEAVLAVRPTARFYIPLTQSSWDGWGGPSESIPHLRPLLEHSAVLGVVVHQYTLDDGVIGHGVMRPLAEWVLASADFMRPLYAELRATLQALDRTEPLEIAITEYHAVANIDILRRVGPTAVTALGLADMLMLYSELGIESAMQHMSLHLTLDIDQLSRSWHVPFQLDGTALHNRPTYTVTKLFADHLYRDVASLQALTMPQLRYETATPAFDYDIVHAIAYVSEDGDAGSVLLLNRDVEGPQQVQLQVPRGWTVSAVTQMAPTDLTSDVDVVPVPTSDAEYVQSGRHVVLTLPPHSFTALQLTR